MPRRMIETNITEEDIKLEGSLRPQTLDDYIGQSKIKENLMVYITAAKQRGDALDHVLFYGPPGLGQTTLAGIIANEMGVHMKVTSGPAIEKPGEMAAILNNLEEGDLLFVDEIHRLNRQVEEVLYPAMEDYCIDIMIGKGSSARSVRLEIHSGGSDHPCRTSDCTSAGSFRHDPSSGILYHRGITADHHAFRPDPGRGDRTGRSKGNGQKKPRYTETGEPDLKTCP